MVFSNLYILCYLSTTNTSHNTYSEEFFSSTKLPQLFLIAIIIQVDGSDLTQTQNNRFSVLYYSNLVCYLLRLFVLRVNVPQVSNTAVVAC